MPSATITPRPASQHSEKGGASPFRHETAAEQHTREVPAWELPDADDDPWPWVPLPEGGLELRCEPE